MSKQPVDPEGKRLPIKLDSTSNGEVAPIPLAPVNVRANRLAHEAASENAKRLGLSRRKFLVSACGAASTLICFNAVNAAAGKRGGYFEIPREAALEPELAKAYVGGNEFIFDVQGHFVNPTGAWVKSAPPDDFKWAPQTACALGSEPGSSPLACIGPDEFVKDVFLDSDTDMMVLSFVPSGGAYEPLTIEEADAVRRIVEKLDGTGRLLLHGRVSPNWPGQLETMEELKERWKISAWKTYTQYGPHGRGYFLSDPIGTTFIEKARSLGVKVICVHKGWPFSDESYEHSYCDDIGVVAKRFPDVSFVVYHSGFNPKDNVGLDSLIHSLQANGVPRGGNVYAELGTTWRHLMRDPDQAAHVLGRLLKYVGEDNILWGTDSIFYGSPQDQIQAFRTFQISHAFREKYGYPEITPKMRAKIFGLNAARLYNVQVAKRARRDHVAELREDYQNNPEPLFLTYGPKTRREFLNLLRWSGGSRI